MLPNRKLGIASFEGRLIGEDDVRFGDAHLDQEICNPRFDAIVLNPDFIVADVDVHNTPMDALLLIPSKEHELVVVTHGINNLLHRNIAIGGLILAILMNDFEYKVAIGYQFVHWIIFLVSDKD